MIKGINSFFNWYIFDCLIFFLPSPFQLKNPSKSESLRSKCNVSVLEQTMKSDIDVGSWVNCTVRDGLLQADGASVPIFREQLLQVLSGDGHDPSAHTEDAAGSAVTVQVTSYDIWQAVPGHQGMMEEEGDPLGHAAIDIWLMNAWNCGNNPLKVKLWEWKCRAALSCGYKSLKMILLFKRGRKRFSI